MIGREPEVATLIGLFAAGSPLVTITGQGGIGKTILALTVAGRLRRRVALVQLADVAATDVGEVIATALADVALDAGSITDQHEVLLVLDTFEQQLAAVVAELRLSCPELAVLVTSRRRLGLREERVLPLAGLPAPDAAVELFLERAAAVGSTISGPGELLSVAAICQLLRGAPLAIELAAERSTWLSPAALLDRLGSGDLLAVLGRGPADVTPRQRSIRASITWSYRLLAVSDQTLLRRLAVFAEGSFSLDAAERVCPDTDRSAGWLSREQVFDGLSTLVDLHFVVPERAAGHPGSPRFRLVEEARCYALELLLTSNEEGQVRTRLADWCLATANESRDAGDPDAERRWLDLIEAELPSIRLTLSGFAGDGDAPGGLELATAVAGYWLQRGPLSEALTWFQSFLTMERDRPAGGRLAKAALAGANGWVHRLRSEMGEPIALDELRISVSAAAWAQSTTQWFRAADHLTEALLRHATNSAEAMAVVDGAISRAHTVRDPSWLCRFLLRRAQLYACAPGGRYDELAGYVEESLAFARTHNQTWVVAQSQLLSGLLRVRERDWTGARTMMTPALDTQVRFGDRLGAVLTMSYMSAVLTELNETAGAAHWLREAMVDAKRIDFGHGELFCAWGVAFLAARAGRLRDAVVMDDILAGRRGVLDRLLPTVLLTDYASAMRQARESLGVSARPARGRDWGWLRARGIDLVGELAAGGHRVGPAEPSRPSPGVAAAGTMTAGTPAVGMVAAGGRRHAARRHAARRHGGGKPRRRGCRGNAPGGTDDDPVDLP